MLVAKQSAVKTVTVGPVLDADGVAVTTAVVGDFKISKNGGAPAALNGSATLTHRHTGKYSLALTATDLDIVGTVEITMDATTNDCPIKEIQVVEESVYDGLYASGAVLINETDVATALLDLADAIETGITPRKAIRLMSAILGGLVSGAQSGSEVFKGLGQASGGTTRATVTADSSGNRSAVSLNL